MNPIPVYQISLTSHRNGASGLVFTSEQEDTWSQSILFVLPITEDVAYRSELRKLIDRQQIFFPFLLGEQYINLQAQVSFPELRFTVPGTDIIITFELRNNVISERFRFYDRGFFKNLKYTGKANYLMVKNFGFLNVVPLDLKAMDQVYLKYGGLFVGLTQNFGELNEPRFDVQ